MARVPRAGTRTGLRKTAKKVEYNVQKLSDLSVLVPKAPKAKKPAAKKGGKKVKKTGATYEVLLKRALKKVEAPGWGLESIMKWLAKYVVTPFPSPPPPSFFPLTPFAPRILIPLRDYLIIL